MKQAYERVWRARLALLLFPLILLSGCINVVPWNKRGSEIQEAKTLARTLKKQVVDAREQLHQEHDIAQQLKITLEESPQMEPSVFREKFNSYIDRLIAIRNKRREIVANMHKGTWESPLVFRVQLDAIQELQREIARTQSWIEMAQNIRLRSDLGREKDFPEFSVLSHELNTFLAETDEDPLGNQLRSLEEEFRFGDADIDSK